MVVGARLGFLHCFIRFVVKFVTIFDNNSYFVFWNSWD